jgi:hypothetical protein
MLVENRRRIPIQKSLALGIAMFCVCLVTVATSASPQSRQESCAPNTGLIDPQGRPIQVICSDYTVTATLDTWTGRHYKIFGSLTVPAGKTLAVRNSLVEIISEYPRQHQIKIQGGSMRTEDAQIGGTALGGVHVQTTISLEPDENGDLPRWNSTNTVVQYSYGIVITAGNLEAWNLSPGLSPDSIIIDGTADVRLHGGTFAISVKTDARSGTDSVLDLPLKRDLSGVYSGAEPTTSGRLLPGARYRLEFDHTTVPEWFLFFKGVTTRASSPQTTLRLRDVQGVVAAIEASDFNGEMTLRSTWVNESVTWGRPLPAGSESRAGNLLLRTETAQTNIPGWGVYLKGSSQAVIRGPTCIVELFLYDGSRAQVLGTPGTFDTLLQATTVELFANSSLLARNVNVGFLPNRNVRGHIGANDAKSIATFEHARYEDLSILRHSKSTIFFADTTPMKLGDGTEARIYPTGEAPTFVRSALTAVSPAETFRNDKRWVGMRIRVGMLPLTVSRLGRYRNPEDAGKHELRLYSSDGSLMTKTKVQASALTDYLGFNYNSVPKTITLQPNTEYILVSREGGKDRFAEETVVTPTATDLTVVGSVQSLDGKTFESGTANRSHGPVNLQYLDRATDPRRAPLP